MGSEGAVMAKPRFLCLHGFRTSGEIMRKQLTTKWPQSVLEKLDLVYADAPFPCSGKSEVEGIFDPPYYEWFQFNKGAILSAALPGLQQQGIALTKVPKIKYLIIIGGAKFRKESVNEKAYGSPIHCPSVHFLGENDFLKEHGTELIESFVDPLVLHHPRGHTIPRFDEKTLGQMHSFLEKLQNEVTKGTDKQDQSSEKAVDSELYV